METTKRTKEEKHRKPSAKKANGKEKISSRLLNQIKGVEDEEKKYDIVIPFLKYNLPGGQRLDFFRPVEKCEIEKNHCKPPKEKCVMYKKCCGCHLCISI